MLNLWLNIVNQWFKMVIKLNNAVENANDNEAILTYKQKYASKCGWWKLRI